MSKKYFKHDYFKIQQSGRSPAFLETPEWQLERIAKTFKSAWKIPLLCSTHQNYAAQTLSFQEK